MAVVGVERDSIELVAPLRFKTIDASPVKCNMGPVSIDLHDFRICQKSGDDSLARYLSCFRPGALKKRFSSFSVGTEKLSDEKLRRCVVVSPREAPSLPILCPSKILTFRSFLKAPLLFLSLPSRKSVHPSGAIVY